LVIEIARLGDRGRRPWRRGRLSWRSQSARQVITLAEGAFGIVEARGRDHLYILSRSLPWVMA
jgi:hypothetical protein